MRDRCDFVITVCDRAKESCPVFPGQPVLAHWGLPDPADAAGTREERLRAFRETATQLARRIDLLLSLPMDKLTKRAVGERLNTIGESTQSHAEQS